MSVPYETVFHRVTNENLRTTHYNNVIAFVVLNLIEPVKRKGNNIRTKKSLTLHRDGANALEFTAFSVVTNPQMTAVKTA